MIRQICMIGVVWLIGGCGPAVERVETAEVVRPARIFEVSSASAVSRRAFVARVEAPQTVDMSFQVDGPLIEFPVREGELIPRGTVIAVLDPSDFKRALREAQVQLDLARADLNRKRQLLNQNLMSVAVVEEADALFKLRQVRLAQAKEDLADTRIATPFDAYISERFVDNHVNIEAGDNIVRVLDLTSLHLIVNIPEQLAATGDNSQIARMYAQFAFAPGRSFELEFLENRGEAGAVAQTYEVTFSMARPEDLRILPGMTATVVLELLLGGDAALHTTVVPPTALVADPDRRYYVWVFNPADGGVTRRYVEVGELGAASVTVTQGLEGGELIVAAGAHQLRDGMRVRRLNDELADPQTLR